MAGAHQANVGKEFAKSDDAQGKMTDRGSLQIPGSMPMQTGLPGMNTALLHQHLLNALLDWETVRRPMSAQAMMPTGGLQEDLQQEQLRNPTPRQRIQVSPLEAVTAEYNLLLVENNGLHRKVRTLENALQNSKIETADLYAQFGNLAEEWANTVRELKDLHKQEREELERINEQLRKENNEMKKIIEDLKKMLGESEKEKRILKVGQIGFQLEILVSQFIFPGNDKNSKRARYGFTLESARGKISNLKNEELRENAKSQLELLEQVMFEEWFIDMIKDIKEKRRGNAHPPLDSYEDMRALVNEEFQDDQDACDDMLRVLEQLKIMYDRIQKPFGEQTP